MKLTASNKASNMKFSLNRKVNAMTTAMYAMVATVCKHLIRLNFYSSRLRGVCYTSLGRRASLSLPLRLFSSSCLLNALWRSMPSFFLLEAPEGFNWGFGTLFILTLCGSLPTPSSPSISMLISSSLSGFFGRTTFYVPTPVPSYFILSKYNFKLQKKCSRSLIKYE